MTSRWIRTNAAALGIANASVPLVFRLAWEAGAADIMIFLWVGLAWGLIIGGLQAWVLDGVNRWIWIGVTTIALIAGWLWTITTRAEDILGTTTLTSQTIDAVQFGLTLGAGIGTLQWLMARRRLGSPLWIARAAIGWALAMVVLNTGGTLIGPSEGLFEIVNAAGLGILGGILLGAVTVPRQS